MITMYSEKFLWEVLLISAQLIEIKSYLKET